MENAASVPKCIAFDPSWIHGNSAILPYKTPPNKAVWIGGLITFAIENLPIGERWYGSHALPVGNPREQRYEVLRFEAYRHPKKGVMIYADAPEGEYFDFNGSRLVRAINVSVPRLSGGGIHRGGTISDSRTVERFRAVMLDGQIRYVREARLCMAGASGGVLNDFIRRPENFSYLKGLVPAYFEDYMLSLFGTYGIAERLATLMGADGGPRRDYWIDGIDGAIKEHIGPAPHYVQTGPAAFELGRRWTSLLENARLEFDSRGWNLFDLADEAHSENADAKAAAEFANTVCPAILERMKSDVVAYLSANFRRPK